MRERIFELEAMKLAARKAGDTVAFMNLSRDMARLAIGAGLAQVNSGVFGRTVNARLSDDLVLVLQGHPYDKEDLLGQAGVDEAGLRQAKELVEELTGEDLSNVELVRAPPLNGEEGSAFACGTRNHAIVIPSEGFQSVDLLVHEYGHTAEFMARRASSDDRLLFSHSTTAETVAYYCQFQYLLRHGTPALRQGAVMAFQRGYFATQFLRAIKSSIRIEDIVAHPVFEPYRKVYQIAQICEYLRPFLRMTPDQIKQTYIDHRYGIPIALKLISHGASIRPMMMAPSHQPVEQAISAVGLSGSGYMNFRKLDELFTSFIDGSIGPMG